jgi:hypothetical protein
MVDPPRPDIRHHDTDPPVFARLAPSKSRLWPANGELEVVKIRADLVDLLDRRPYARIVNVTSNEPEGPRRPHQGPDIRIVGDLIVLLRAERDPRGEGRIYTIEVEGSDRSGNTTVDTVQVEVPRHHH